MYSTMLVQKRDKGERTMPLFKCMSFLLTFSVSQQLKHSARSMIHFHDSMFVMSLSLFWYVHLIHVIGIDGDYSCYALVRNQPSASDTIITEYPAYKIDLLNRRISSCFEKVYPWLSKQLWRWSLSLGSSSAQSMGDIIIYPLLFVLIVYFMTSQPLDIVRYTHSRNQIKPKS